MKNKFVGAESYLSYLFFIFTISIMIGFLIINIFQPFDNNELAMRNLRYLFGLGFFVFIGSCYIRKKPAEDKEIKTCLMEKILLIWRNVVLFIIALFILVHFLFSLDESMMKIVVNVLFCPYIIFSLCYLLWKRIKNKKKSP